MAKSTEEKPDGITHIVIVRGGFAGLNCARKLAANPHVRITPLDKNNYAQFHPLPYQVATAVLPPSNIALNLRVTLRSYPNVRVNLAEVVAVDLNTRLVRTAQAEQYQGDFLVLAAGSRQTSSVRRERMRTAIRYIHFPMLSGCVHVSSPCSNLLIALGKSPKALNVVIVGAGPTLADGRFDRTCSKTPSRQSRRCSGVEPRLFCKAPLIKSASSTFSPSTRLNVRHGRGDTDVHSYVAGRRLLAEFSSVISA